MPSLSWEWVRGQAGGGGGRRDGCFSEWTKKGNRAGVDRPHVKIWKCWPEGQESVFSCILCTGPRVNPNTAINSTAPHTFHNSPLCSFCLVTNVEIFSMRKWLNMLLFLQSHTSPLKCNTLGVNRDYKLLQTTSCCRVSLTSYRAVLATAT